MSKKLGKGLEALLGSRDKESMSALMEDRPDAPAQEGELREIPIDLIRPGKFQPRQDMRAQALEELAQSIHQQGVMQPVVVREIGQGRFELIAGERRWRACQLSGLKAIPALVKSASDRDVVSMSLIENIQREDLNPIEQAAALQRLQEEFGYTQQEVAKEVGKSRESVANLLRLLGLEPDVRAMLEKGELEMGHARALLGVSDSDQPKLAREVARKQLSVRQTEDLVRRHLSRTDATPTTRERDPDLARLEDSLSEKLGARVAIQHTAKGKGKLVVNYNTVAELEGILSHIK